MRHGVHFRKSSAVKLNPLPIQHGWHESTVLHFEQRKCHLGAVCTIPLGTMHGSLRNLVFSMQRYGEEYAVVSLDKDAKVATLANGQSIQYDALVSTMPLDITLRWLGQPDWADTLSHRWGHHSAFGSSTCIARLPQQPLRPAPHLAACL